MADAAQYRCGLVAVVGRTNVGKSTLVNRLLGQKLSITSSKPQTTRHRILGIHTTAAAQTIYVDTPGVHDSNKRALNRYLNRTAFGAIEGVDLVLLVVEASTWRAQDTRVVKRLKTAGKPTLLALNKIDRLASRAAVLPRIAAGEAQGEFVAIVPLSARSGDNVDRLHAQIVALLPDGAPLFAADQITDRSERFLTAERVREQLTRRLNQELPYCISVEIEHWEEARSGVKASALIWVEGHTQKRIVIGNQGKLLKQIGIKARNDIAHLIGRPVHLKLWVKVRQGWSDDDQALRGLGYGDK